MAFEALLAEYEARRAKALAGGGADKYAKRTAKGILNARERIAHLVDADSFMESGLFGSSGVYPEQADETQTDGKLAGFAKIDGRDVAVVLWWSLRWVVITCKHCGILPRSRMLTRRDSTCRCGYQFCYVCRAM